jgi:glycosyltransferase involved in cell wall biosynthesis
MKILLFDNSGMNPNENDFCVEQKTGNFAKELKALNNEITFFGQIIPESDNNIYVFGINKNGMKVCGLKRKRNKTLNYFFLYLRAIPAVIDTDFVYIFYPTAFKYVAFIAKLFGKKYGLYIRGMQDLDGRASHWIYKNAYTVFSVSDYFTQSVNKIAGKDIARNVRPMISFTEADIVKDREYEEKDIYQLLFLGRTTDDKGVIELIKAVAALKETCNNFFLKIVGNGEYIEELLKLSERLSISQYISFEGSVYDPIKIQEYYKTADIYILPSYHEGFPRTLYEAMIFGTPIITTFVGGIPALMKDGYNCKEITPKSVLSIITTLVYAMSNYSIMGQLAKNGTSTVERIVNSKHLTHAQHLNQIINT